MRDLLLKKEFILRAIEEIRRDYTELRPDQQELFKNLDESSKSVTFQIITKPGLMIMMIELTKMKQYISKKLERAV